MLLSRSNLLDCPRCQTVGPDCECWYVDSSPQAQRFMRRWDSAAERVEIRADIDPAEVVS